nr:MAG TPA: hypothetical protein [Caudoviricetes sp.]
MASIDSITKGIACFADREIIDNLPDAGSKFAVGAIITLALKRAENIVSSYKDNKIVKALGIIDENNNIDIDVVMECLKERMPKSGVEIKNIPILHEIRFTSSDLDSLYKDIQKYM